MDSLQALHQRLRANPAEHLGRKSVQLIAPYEFGYETGRHRCGQGDLPSRVSGQAVQAWAERHFGWTAEEGCRQNLASFALLTADDEAAAFDRYFELYDTASREVPEGERPVDSSSEIIAWASRGLIPCIQDMQSRPGMYLGGPLLDHLWAFCNGFFWAERDAARLDSQDHRIMTGFQRWLEERYPFARGRPWNRILNFLALSVDKRAWDSFHELFALYRAGAAPDTLSQVGATVLKNVTQGIVDANPGEDAAGVRERCEHIVKRICP